MDFVQKKCWWHHLLLWISLLDFTICRASWSNWIFSNKFIILLSTIWYLISWSFLWVISLSSVLSFRCNLSCTKFSLRLYHLRSNWLSTTLEKIKLIFLKIIRSLLFFTQLKFCFWMIWSIFDLLIMISFYLKIVLFRLWKLLNYVNYKIYFHQFVSC